MGRDSLKMGHDIIEGSVKFIGSLMMGRGSLKMGHDSMETTGTSKDGTWLIGDGRDH